MKKTNKESRALVNEERMSSIYESLLIERDYIHICYKTHIAISYMTSICFPLSKMIDHFYPPKCLSIILYPISSHFSSLLSFSLFFSLLSFLSLALCFHNLVLSFIFPSLFDSLTVCRSVFYIFFHRLFPFSSSFPPYLNSTSSSLSIKYIHPSNHPFIYLSIYPFFWLCDMISKNESNT